MFKKSFLNLSICASFFIGCGGGGGSSGTSSGATPIATVQKYDLYNYYIPSSVLSENKILVENLNSRTYQNGILTGSVSTNSISQKNSENKIDYYYNIINVPISNIQDYNNAILNKTVYEQLEVLTDELKSTYYYDNSISSLKRNLFLGDKLYTKTDNYNGRIDTCNLNKYYDSIDIKDKINSFFEKEYETSSKTYFDVLEVICTNNHTDQVSLQYYAKNIGEVLNVSKRTIFESTNVLNTTKLDYIYLLNSQLLLTK